MGVEVDQRRSLEVVGYKGRVKPQGNVKATREGSNHKGEVKPQGKGNIAREGVNPQGSGKTTREG